MTREHRPSKLNGQHLGVTFILPKPIILCEQCVATVTEPAVTELPRRRRSRGRRGAIIAEVANFMCAMVYSQDKWTLAQTQ